MKSDLPPRWRRGNIRRFASMKTGHTPSRSNPDYWEDVSIPWFTLADVWQLRDGRQIYLGDTASRISELGLANSAAELLPPGTVVLSRTASVGFSGVMPIAMATSQDFWNWVCGPDLLPEYLNYQFKAIAPKLRAMNMGSTHQTIYQRDAASIEVLVPPPAEQRAIVDYLDRETARIDTLITEQQRLIVMLRERHGAVADLLLNPGGPKYPMKRAVDDITVGIVVNPSAWYAQEGVPALRGLNVRPGRITTDDLVYLSPDGDARHEKSRLHTGDVVVVRTGQAGAAAVVPSTLDGVNAIDLLIVRPGSKVDPEFLSAYLNSPSTRSRIAENSVGAIQGHFNVGALKELVFPALSLMEQRDRASRWIAQASAIDTLVAEADKFIALARERRSAIIAAAVTGQIDVEAEAA